MQDLYADLDPNKFESLETLHCAAHVPIITLRKGVERYPENHPAAKDWSPEAPFPALLPKKIDRSEEESNPEFKPIAKVSVPDAD